MSNNSYKINIKPPQFNFMQKIGLGIGMIGLVILVLALAGMIPNTGMMLSISLLSLAIGIVIFAINQYKDLPLGIKNHGNWFGSISSRGAIGWIIGVALTSFYIFLYWYPQYLGQGSGDTGNTGLIGFFDPLSMFLKGKPASQWFVYGVLYTLAILGFGFKFILKYKHNKYQQLRTISVMFFQLAFAFLLPEILQGLNQPYYNFANMWPLNYYFFDKWHVNGLLSTSNISLFMFAFGLAMVFLISPFLTYKYGKRWYCSWVCGCGGLAETAGDSFRHLSDNSLKSWKFERWSIHIVLVMSLVMTIAVVGSYLNEMAGTAWVTRSQFMFAIIGFLVIFVGILFKYRGHRLNKDEKYAILAVAGVIIILILMNVFSGAGNNIFFKDSYTLRKWYGFAIGSAFSGVIGVGFYPVLGSRVWCRFGCPMAAMLGIQQKFFSRFRITTNGGQCISCGNCSTYCEMGIDVRSYAQKGQDIVRASCVGCGVCSSVCPRGVLRLENGSVDIDVRTDAFRNIHCS